jgi:methylated-DNA-protein-cysteine methyltransferase related protein
VTSYEKIYAVVRKIPKGRVATYGDVARIAGLPRQARLVGYALHALHDGTTLPWHRVINAQGKLSLARSGSSAGLTQRLRLEREGVRVDAAAKVSLERYGWKRLSGKSRSDRGATRAK